MANSFKDIVSETSLGLSNRNGLDVSDSDQGLLKQLSDLELPNCN